MSFGQITMPGEVLAGLIALVSVAGVGITSWMLVTLVRLTAVVAAMEECINGHERRLNRLEERP